LKEWIESEGSLTVKEYCSEVCGGKCCYVYHEDKPLTACPQLNEQKLCSIYRERYELNQPYSFSKKLRRGDKLFVINTKCGRIEDLIKNHTLPKEIEDQCCFAHPELLQRVK